MASESNPERQAKRPINRRSLIRSYRPDGYGDLKEATADLIEQCGGVRRAADNCRVGKSQLSDYANTYNEDTFITADVVLQLEKASGRRCITEHLAFEHGCLIVELPPGEPGSNWLAQFGQCAKDHGEVLRLGGEILNDDGNIDENEAQRLLREVDENLNALAGLREMLRSVIPKKTS